MDVPAGSRSSTGATTTLFQPLLYQVATAALSPADIALPIRSVLRDQRNVAVRLGEVVGVDRAAREVLLPEERIPFDYLILATGARHSYFGRDEWAAHAPGTQEHRGCDGDAQPDAAGL